MSKKRIVVVSTPTGGPSTFFDQWRMKIAAPTPEQCESHMVPDVHFDIPRSVIDPGEDHVSKQLDALMARLSRECMIPADLLYGYRDEPEIERLGRLFFRQRARSWLLRHK